MMRHVSKIIALLVFVPTIAFSAVLKDEDFEDTSYDISKRATETCAPGVRFNEGGDRGWVWKDTLNSSGSGTCCEQTYIGWQTASIGVGNPVYHSFWIKYGDSGNTYTWSNSCSGWGHEYKFPDIYAGDDRVIVKHNTAEGDSTHGVIVIYLSPRTFPPKTSGGRAAIIAAGHSIVAEDGDGLANPIATNTWYHFQFAMYENGDNDYLKIWENNDTEGSPSYHYTGNLYDTGANWNSTWYWGYRNHGFDNNEVMYYDDIIISDSFIEDGGDEDPPELSSATIAADGNTLTLVFDEAVTQGSGYNDSDWDLDCTKAGDGIGITYSSGDGTTSHIYTIDQDIDRNDTVNIDFNGDTDSEEDEAGNDLAAIVSDSVTNNSAVFVGICIIY